MGAHEEHLKAEINITKMMIILFYNMKYDYLFSCYYCIFIALKIQLHDTDYHQTNKNKRNKREKRASDSATYHFQCFILYLYLIAFDALV